MVNWTLVIQLSLFGLAMGIATVFVIPSSIEPLFWLVIFGVTAYVIATRSSGKYFQHGLLVGIVNGVWVTGSHVLLFQHYVANHPQEAEIMKSMPLADIPRVNMILVGSVIGVVSGLVIGLCAVIAGKLVGVRARPPVAS
jgi:hypothetical protein